jgi:hypothetical protein
MPRLDHVIRNKLRDSQRWWLYWLEIFSKEERQFLLLLCEKHASFVWCSEVEDTLNKCVDVRFCEHERLSIRRSNCGSVTAHRNGLSIRIRATNSMFIASDDSTSRVFKLMMEMKPTLDFYIRCGLFDWFEDQVYFFKFAVVSSKKNRIFGIFNFLFLCTCSSERLWR